VETFETISKRSSIREYNDQPVYSDLLEKIVDAGRRAPSARAVEPWDFIVVTKKDILNEIASLAPNGKFIQQAPSAIIVVSDETKYYLEDGSAATENILLACSDLGLGACWIAGDKKDYAASLLKLLDVPDSKKLISIISIGWPAQEKPQTKNRTLQDVLHWERF